MSAPEPKTEDVPLGKGLHVAFYAGLTATLLLASVSVYAELGRPVEVEQRYLPALQVVDRCETCHDAAAHPGGWTESHPPERFACTPCHGGQGFALTQAAAHGDSPGWERPLYSPAEREAACGACHEGSSVVGAPQLSRGRALIQERSCAGCHEIPGFSLPSRAPELDGLRDKTSPAWTRSWLESPSALNADRQMPTFSLIPRQRDALVSFLFSTQGPSTGPLPAGGDPERGRAAVAYRRCNTCHRIDGRGGGDAPDLALAGAKLKPDWLWSLLTDTHRLRPHTRMPGFRLSSEEAADIVAWAGQQWVPDTAEPPWAAQPDGVDPALTAEGRALFSELGCAGCHAIAGVPRDPAGPSLVDIGDRQQADLPRAGASASVDLPHWIATKILVPTAFDTPGARPSAMPASTGLTPDDALAIGVAIASLHRDGAPGGLRVAAPAPRDHVPAGAVGDLVERYRCLECHELGGVGGTLSGVDLDGEGSRVERAWLRSFLQEPVTIRMNQSARMPVLGLRDEEATLLADWISTSLADPAVPEAVTPGDAAAGKAAYARLACASCHVVAGEGAMEGPVLDGAGARLRPAYVVALLSRGGPIVPGSRHGATVVTETEARDIAAWALGL